MKLTKTITINFENTIRDCNIYQIPGATSILIIIIIMIHNENNNGSVD